MKRCNECGWSNNPADSYKCIKCGSPLDETSQERISFQGVEKKESDSDLKKTIIGRKSDKQALDGTNPTLKKEDLQESSCQYCNYPLRAGSLSCPNCGSSVNMTNEPINKTLMFGDTGFNNLNTETFAISLSDQSGNKFEFDIQNQEKQIGRSELDENNKSISSSHAQFSVVNGKLNLEDISSNAMTFVQVKDKTELNDGDVVILGNQMYKLKFIVK
ncbi:FHA domain-containing protein [Lutibacter sp.]|uniref:FHA domain-containing protein n=1 Tax=Lutibacter sp. TaxID=1925666 RepID=UPI0035676321